MGEELNERTSGKLWSLANIEDCISYNANIPKGQSITLGFSGDGIEDVSVVGEHFVLYAVNEVEPVEDIDYEKDTDQDDLPDYYEEELGTDPLKSDTDGDGLDDGYEYWELMTEPLLIDSDSNGINHWKG